MGRGGGGGLSNPQRGTEVELTSRKPGRRGAPARGTGRWSRGASTVSRKTVPRDMPIQNASLAGDTRGACLLHPTFTACKPFGTLLSQPCPAPSALGSTGLLLLLLLAWMLRGAQGPWAGEEEYPCPSLPTPSVEVTVDTVERAALWLLGRYAEKRNIA